MKLRLGIPREVCRKRPSACSPAPGCAFTPSARSYFAATDDPEIECLLIRAQENGALR